MTSPSPRFPQMIGFSGKFGAGKDAVAAAVADHLTAGRWAHISFGHALRMEVNDFYVACGNGHLRPRFTFRSADGVDVPAPKLGVDRPRNADGSCYEIVATEHAGGACLEKLEDGSVCGSDAELPVDSYQRSPATRSALQWHGTDLRRAEDRDYWARRAIEAARSELSSPDVDLAVFTDVRFPNEVDAIKDAGGVVVRLFVSPETRDARLLARDGHLPPPGASDHPSETALNEYTDFDLVLSNDGAFEDTVQAVLDFLASLAAEDSAA